MIVFYKCSKCGNVGDLNSHELTHTQNNPHNYFWGSPARCDGYYVVPSSQQDWEKQNGRVYPKHLLALE